MPTCKDCEAWFELEEGEVRFFLGQGLELPKRCASCRAARQGITDITLVCARCRSTFIYPRDKQLLDRTSGRDRPTMCIGGCRGRKSDSSTQASAAPSQQVPEPVARSFFSFLAAVGRHFVSVFAQHSEPAGAPDPQSIRQELASSARQTRSPSTRPSGRAPEFPGGRITQSGFTRTASAWLGPENCEQSPGRYVSADGMRQIRFGAHESREDKLHAHFEAYDNACCHLAKRREGRVATLRH